MHEGRRPFVHLFSYHLKAGRIRRGQGPDSARKATEDSGRRLQREGFWSMDSGVEPAGCQGCRAAIYSSYGFSIKTVALRRG